MTLIVIVEDEFMLAQLIQELLTEEGYQVLIAGNGHAALSLIREHRPALIISDMMMPLMGGQELCLHVQGDPTLAAIPIILMSAAASLPAHTQCHWAAFIRKPFELIAFLTTIKDQLTNPRPANTVII